MAIKIAITNSPWHTISAAPVSVTAIGIASNLSPDTLLALPAATTLGGMFTPLTHGQYELTLGTAGLQTGQYSLKFSIAGDAAVHSIGFNIQSAS
jgi:hypothetical protein